MVSQKKTIILFFPVFDYGNKGCEYIPYALLHLERAVRHLNMNVVLIDENLEPDFEQIIIRYSEDLLLAAVSAITGYQIKGGIAFSKAIRKHAPQASVVWGGWHPTIVPKQTLEESFIDFIVCGQGETPFLQLTESLLDKSDFASIPGLGYKKENKLCINPRADFCSVNQFPVVDYSLIDINNYVLKTDFSERRIMYFASYGCPFSCPFCSGAQVFKKRWFPKEIDTIINDIKYFVRVASIDSLLFWDDNFFSNKKFILDFANRLIAEKISLLWEGSAHARAFINVFNEEDLELLYRAGLRRVSTGAESGNDTVLQTIKDNLTHTDVLQLIKRLRVHGITVFFSTMTGYPLDVYNDIHATFKLIRYAKLVDNQVKIQINIFTPYPQTPLYEMAIKKGFLEPSSLEGWINHAPARFKPLWLKPSFYDRLEAYMNFYLPFSEKTCYQRAPASFKRSAKVFNTLFRPLIMLRLKFNIFILPFEWILFKRMLKHYNKKHNDNLRFYAYGVFGS